MTPHPSAAWWLLGLGFTSLALAINALRPIYKPAVASGLSFFAGWWTADLALHHLAIQAGLTAWWIGTGEALRGWPGWLGLGALGLSWLGLLRCQQLAQATRTRVLDQLPDLAAAAPPPGEAHRLAAWRLIVPLPFRPGRVEKLANLPYRQVAGRTLGLDVYRHRSRPGGSPVLLEIHGGGWVIGSKREQGLPLLHHLAAQGWLCVTADYRLSPGATFPEPIHDIKHALAWIQRHGPEYGADPERVVITGGSAGGHLAALAALTGNDPTLQPGLEDVDTRVQGCIAMYALYDLLDPEGLANPGLKDLLERTVVKRPRSGAPDLYRAWSPIERLHDGAPPFLVLHGQLDTLAPIAGTRRFVQAFKARCRAPVDYAELPGGHHAFDIFPSARCHGAVDLAARWANRLITRLGKS